MIPLSVFLIPYALFLFVFFFFSFVNIYHLIHYTTSGFWGFFSTVVFAAVTVVILSATYTAVIQIDWSRTIQIIPSFSAPTFIP